MKRRTEIMITVIAIVIATIAVVWADRQRLLGVAIDGCTYQQGMTL